MTTNNLYPEEEFPEEIGRNCASAPITSFSGQYAFLSNFYPSPIYYNGLHYPTVEHAYQSMKTEDHGLRVGIAALLTPGEAKKVGRKLKYRDNWEAIKMNIMRACIYDKFTQNRDLAQKLLDTGDSYLTEGNWWGDTFWGVCGGVGRNELGKQLMEMRDLIPLWFEEQNENK